MKIKSLETVPFSRYFRFVMYVMSGPSLYLITNLVIIAGQYFVWLYKTISIIDYVTGIGNTEHTQYKANRCTVLSIIKYAITMIHREMAKVTHFSNPLSIST